MSPLLKLIVNTGIFTLILAIGGLLVTNFYPGFLDRQSIFIMLISMFLIALTVFIISYSGSSKEADAQMIYSFAAIGAKFILSAVLALIYFKAFKKEGMNNIILFFVLYLSFTVYVITIVLKTLNDRSLKSDQN